MNSDEEEEQVEHNEEEEDQEEEEEEQEPRWIVNDICISDLCFDLKLATIILAKKADPAQLSDVRLLVLNDIYKIDRNFEDSVSKYFSTKIHSLLKPSFSFDGYLPKRGSNCYDWCLQLEMSPPDDWMSSMSLCARMLTEACQSNNILDMHTSQVLTQVLPVLVNGPAGDVTEDSYVHYYLSPLLASVFASDPLLKMKWANGKLMNSQHAHRPDFTVYNISGSIKCDIVIAEFKPTEKNSHVESDLVKLAREMKGTLNKLVMKGAVQPRVCGIHCQGENVLTYIMDLPSPKLYRLINVSKIKLFKNLDQISLLPNVITHLLCLKNVASETATKIEDAALY
jgi:hypothetical protein